MTLAFILGCTPVTFADNEVGQRESEFLTAIGIYSSKEISSSITRADFAEVAAKLIGGTEDSFVTPDRRLFIDVDENTNNVGAIGYLFNQGIIAGYGNAAFEPDKNLTCQEAVKIIVSLMGYEQTAEVNGGYYTGYLAAARSMGLLKGVLTGYESDIDTGNLAVMIVNAMESDIMNLEINGTKVSMSTDKGVTLMGKYLNMGKYTGIVNGYDYTSLESAATEYAKGTVSIGDMVFDVGKVDAEKYLGMNVEAYYVDDDGEYTLVYINEKRNNIVYIDRDNIEQASVTEVEYFKNADDNRTTKAKIDTNAIYIYNGKKIVMVSDEDLFPNCGSLKLIDNNNDSRADVVIINDYKEAIVSSVLATEKKVITKYDNETLDFDDEEIKFYIGEDEAEFTDISKTSILSIAESKNTSGNKVVKVIITDEIVTGTIKGFTGGNGEATATVNGEDYDFSVQFNIYKGMGKVAYPSTGDVEYEFRLNMEGKIAYYKMAVGGRKYAYVIRTWLDDDEEDVRYIKMYTSDGEFLRIPMKEKVSFNGTKTLSKNLEIENEQLIVYDVDSAGSLSKIDIAQDKTAETYYTAKDDEFVLHYKSPLIEREQDGIVEMVYQGMRFYKNFAENKPFRFIKGKTIYFQIPQDKTKEADYKVITDLGTTDITVSGPISIYDSKAGGVISAMVAGELGGSDSYDTPQMVDNISEILDDDDQVCTQINFVGGNSVILSPDVRFVQPAKKDSKGEIKWSKVVDYSNVGIKDLKHGDVIQYVTTAGYVTKIMVLVRVDNIGPERVDGDHIARSGNIVGKVLSVNEDGNTALIYYVDRFGNPQYQAMQIGGTVMKYDSSAKKGDYTTSSDVREGDTVLLNSFWWSIKATFIFR